LFDVADQNPLPTGGLFNLSLGPSLGYTLEAIQVHLPEIFSR
jgi:hypothetical protein